MVSGNEIRSSFLSFFSERGHTEVASSPIVPENDATLLFTNSGMVQFKGIFTGAQPPLPSKRAVTAQKCVRAGGKHNDLDNVGYTARHHTFFEMLGNFSFGDYFKEQAIEFHWQLVTRVFELPKEKIIATVYGEDDEAFDLWRRIAGLDERRILRIHSSDNFWSMGDTGPCGPCSELFYDHGPAVAGGPPGSPDEDGDRFVEFVNLVFMQYERHADGRRTDLPQKSIDTGMGLERMAAILQGSHDNFATDLFRPLIEAAAGQTGCDPDGSGATSFRVIADHLRCSAFLIAEGVLPSNEGRGYVLRRIIRRALRHAHTAGAKEPLMHRLAPLLVGQFGSHYGELRKAQALIDETLLNEEERFKETLARGLRLLEEATAGLGPGSTLAGEVAFRLYDTYGFPLDLTCDILREKDLQVDQEGFDKAMAGQRRAAREAGMKGAAAADEGLWLRLHEWLGPTTFVGYDGDRCESSRLVALIVNGEEVERAEAGAEVAALFAETPCYAEAGGQQGDRGRARFAGGELAIQDTQKRDGALHVHEGRVSEGSIAVGDLAAIEIDRDRRSGLRIHHSATHLLHEALRRELGDHVSQKGSLVAPDRLRFDISHNSPVKPAELEAIEREVKERIRAATAVAVTEMDRDEALTLGAQAQFGEKYGDRVRVVSMGEDSSRGNGHWSVELCGGTHVDNTGEVGSFKLIREEGLAAGVRRLEAVAGAAADQWLEKVLSERDQRIADLMRETRSLRKALSERDREIPFQLAGALPLVEVRDAASLRAALSEAQASWGKSSGALRLGRAGGPEIFTYASCGPSALSGDDAREVARALARQRQGAVVLASDHDGKALVTVALAPALKGRLNAGQLVRLASATLGGGGGGSADQAQAGGPAVEGLNQAVLDICEAIQQAPSS